jgi:PAS domain S-box-containing protein
MSNMHTGGEVGDSSLSKRDPSRRKPPYEDLEQRLRDLEKESERLKRRNEALKKTIEKYRAIVESQTEFICRFLPDGTLTFVNDALARRIQKRPERLIDQNIYQYLAPEDRDGVREKLATLSPENPSVEIEERILNREHEVTWLHWINTAVCGQKGRVVEIQGVGRDVTELKRVQESLEKSEQRFQYFLETMSEGFGQVDENLIMVYANLKLCEMLGYERGELLGRRVMTLLDEESKKIVRKNFQGRKKGESGSYEITWKKKNGEHLRVLMSPTPQYDEKGVFRGGNSVITDITKLKQAEQALKDREKALSRKKTELSEANLALKTLLRLKDESIQEQEEEIVSNLKQMVMPYLRKLKKRLSEKEMAYIRNIESNLDKILSPLTKNLASKQMGLTPAELQVAALVKDGNSSKEIASLLNVSQRTVDFHRRNIRKKLGLDHTRANLRAHLMSLE